MIIFKNKSSYSSRKKSTGFFKFKTLNPRKGGYSRTLIFEERKGHIKGRIII